MISDDEILKVANQCLYGGKDYGIIEFAHRIAEMEREALDEIATSELRNCSLLASNPPQSSAAWNIRNAIRARGETK